MVFVRTTVGYVYSKWNALAVKFFEVAGRLSYVDIELPFERDKRKTCLGVGLSSNG